MKRQLTTPHTALRRLVSMLIVGALAFQWDTPSSVAQNGPSDGTGEQPDEGSGNVVIGIGVVIGVGVGAIAGDEESQEKLAEFWDDTEDVFTEVGDFFSDGWNGIWNDEESEVPPEPIDPAEVLADVKDSLGDFGGEIGRLQKLDPESIVSSEISAPALAQEAVPAKQGAASGQELPPDTNTGTDPGSTEAATDPVALFRGEFVHKPVDLQVVAFGLPLTLQRTYRSRVDFDGPLGPAWDHSLNLRLFEADDEATCATEVIVSLGDLAPLRFRPSASEAQMLGESRVLFSAVGSAVRAELENDPSSSACPWLLTLQDRTLYCFDSDGLGTRVESPTRVRIVLEWQEIQDGFRLQRAVRRFSGEDTHAIAFHYESQNATTLERAVLTEGGSTIEEVRYDYNSSGELEVVRDERLDVVRERYDYADAEEIEDDPPAREGLATYCEEFCLPTSADTCGGSTSYCEDKIVAVRNDCPATCAASCQEDCAAHIDGPLRQQAIDECVRLVLEIKPNASRILTESECEREYYEYDDQLTDACVAGCEPECLPQCQTTFSAADCSDACEDACQDLATDSTYVYGRKTDLAHNLTTVIDGAGFEMTNLYGTDPEYPNFDAVKVQYFGDTLEVEVPPLLSFVAPESKAVQFEYYDLQPYTSGGATQFDVTSDPLTRVGLTRGVDQLAPNGHQRICSSSLLDGPLLGGPHTFLPSGDRQVVYLVGGLDPLPLVPNDLWGRDPSEITLVQLGENVLERIEGLPLGFERAIRFGDFQATLNDEGTLDLEQLRGTAELTATRVFNTYDVAQPSALERARLDDFAVFASASFRLNDRAKVKTADGGWATVGTFGGQLNLGVEAVVGDVVSNGSVTLRDRAKVQGDVIAPVVNIPGQATIEGANLAGTTSELALPNFSFVFPAPDRGDLMLEPDQSRGPAPGSYRTVSVKSRSRLTLTAGVYFVESMHLEPDSILEIDARLGPIYIYIKNNFTFRGAIQSSSGRHDELFVGYLGTGTASVERPFSGTLVAPKGTINLATVQSPHRGAFYGKTIEVHQQSEVIHHPFPGDWVPFGQGGATADADGERTFSPPRELIVPAGLGVTSGNAGQGEATLEFTTAADVVVACEFRGNAPLSHPVSPEDVSAGLLYKLVSCSNGVEAGDELTVSGVLLSVGSADSLAPSGDVRVLAKLPLVVDEALTPIDALRDAAGIQTGGLVAVSNLGGSLEVLGEIQGAAVITQGGCSRGFSLELDEGTGEFIASPASACTPGTKLVPLLATESAQQYMSQLGGGTGTLVLGSGIAQTRADVAGAGMTIDDWLKVADATRTTAGIQALRELAGLTPRLQPARSASEVVAVIDQLTLFAQATPGSEDMLTRLDELRLTLAEGFLTRDDKLPTIEVIPDYRDPLIVRDFTDELGLFEGLSSVMTSFDLPGFLDAHDRGHELEAFACRSADDIPPPHTTFYPSDRGVARFATVVTGPDRETILSYYSNEGHNLRVANIDRQVAVSYEYDADHNRRGRLKHHLLSLEAVEPRVCSKYDSRGLVKEITRSSMDYDAHQTTCVSHDELGPWVTRVTEAGDSTSLVFSAAYSAAGDPELTLDANSLLTSYDYDGSNRLESRTDPTGSRTTFGAYDPEVQFPTSITEDADEEGRYTELDYSDWGQFSAIRRHGWGATQIWNYDERTRLGEYSVAGDEGSFESEFGYLDNGVVETITDDLGTTRLTYDRARDVRTIQRTSGANQQLTCLFQRPDGALKISVDPQGARRRTEHLYSQQGSAHSVTLTTFVDEDEEDGCATPAGDTLGNVDGVVSIVRQDYAGRPMYVEDGAGNFESLSYDEWGRVALRVLGQGGTRRAVRRYYDHRDRLIAEVETAGAGNDPPATAPTANDLGDIDGFARAVFLEHDRGGRLRAHSLYAGAPGQQPTKAVETTYDFDDSDRRVVIEQQTPDGARHIEAEYDGLARPTQVTTNFGYSASVAYPTFLRSVVETRAPDGSSLSLETEYNRSGLPRSVAVNGEEVESLGYDALGRVTSAVRNDAETVISYAAFGGTESIATRRDGADDVLEDTSFGYDSRGRLTSVRTGDAVVAEYRYDVLGRLREERRARASNPASTATWSRSFVGTTQQVERLELPSDRTLEYEYADGRPIIESLIASGAGVSNLAGPDAVRLDYDHDGLTTDATVLENNSETSTLTAHFDGLGRLSSEQAVLANHNHSVERSWGVGVGLTGLTVNGEHFSYERLDDGRLDRVVRDGHVLLDNQFDGDGVASRVSYGNGLTETRSFDELGRMLSQEVPGFSVGYGYGTDQMLRRVTTEVSGATDRSVLFETDAVGRIGAEHLGVPSASSLASGTITNAAIQAYEGDAETSRHFSYDSANNWTSVSHNLEPAWSPAPNAANAYAQTPTGAASYDADGRLSSDGERDYGYDALGRLAEVTGPGVDCSYEYDANGRRTEATCNGQTTRFGYDGADVVAIYDQAGTKIALREVALATPFVLFEGQDATYLLAGAPRSVYAAFDESGELVETYEYSAFGETTTEQHGASPSGNPFKFHGHIELALAGLYDMRARAYAPRMGRFVAPDPLGPHHSPNLYAIVENRPHERWDPMGLSSAPATTDLGEFVVTGCGGAIECEELPPEAVPSGDFDGYFSDGYFSGGGYFGAGSSPAGFSTGSTGLFGGGQAVNVYQPNSGAYYSVAGGSGWQTPGGLPFMGPGGQPFHFYLGNQAHLAIGTRFVAVNPNAAFDRSLTEVAMRFGAPTPIRFAEGILRPDLVNFDTYELYEIKPVGMEGLGMQELQMYMDALYGSGVPVVPGRMGSPGTAGVVTSPDGGVFRYGMAAPGLIVYQPMPILAPLPIDERSRFDVSNVAAPVGAAAAAYVSYKVARGIAVSFAATPIAGAASLAVP